MKLDAVLGTILLGSLLACSGSKEEPAQQPAAVEMPERKTDETKPAAQESTPANTPAPATTDPAATTPADPAPVAETCESLAAKAKTPAGKLTDVQSIHGMYGIEPIDVFATEDEGGLHLVLTETANTCAYHANKLQTENKNELTIDFPKTDTAFAPGTFKPSSFAQEAGNVCFTKELPPGVGSAGTAFGGGSARGKLTITAKTATLVEGTVSITDFSGGKTIFTFSAPICAALDPAAETTCCASPAEE